MEQEKELLEKKIEWLTVELKTKTDELLNTNREKGKEILELQGSLKNSKEQVTHKQNPRKLSRSCSVYTNIPMLSIDIHLLYNQ